MSYENMSDLANDQEFAARLASAVCEQAKTRETEYVAQAGLRSPTSGAQMFMPFVSTEPGFADAYADGGQEAITDGQILSAVQANWNAVAVVWAPATGSLTVPV